MAATCGAHFVEPGSRHFPEHRRRAVLCDVLVDGGGSVPGLLALALGLPVPTAVNPGPSAGVLSPIAGNESRTVGGLDDVPPRLPYVLRSIPGPKAPVPSIAREGGRRCRFHQWCRRWRGYNSIG